MVAINIREQIRTAFAHLGVPAFAVGGAVRDAISGREPRDMDIAIDAPISQIGPRVAQALGGTFVPVGVEHGAARVVFSDGDSIDIAEIQGGDIRRDLQCRDFSVNAMAVNIATNEIIDPFGGERDLRDGVLRAVSPQAFIDDPVRLLRAVRQSAEHGLEIEAATQALIRRDAALISRPAPERVRDEMMKIFSQPRPGSQSGGWTIWVC